MNPTKQQVAIKDALNEHDLVKVSAVAGSGKTSTLIYIVNELKPQRGLYVAFNKAVATEAKHKFPSTIDSKTIHSLAYLYVASMGGRKVGKLTYGCFTEDISYEMKYDVIQALDSFFNSSFVLPSEYAKKSRLDPILGDLMDVYFNKMVEGKIDVPFGFLLKYLQIMLMDGVVDIPEYDLIMLDEAGDVTGVTLDIFMRLPAKKKLLVGDPHQNIYSFMDTVNGFKILEGQGIQLPLSQSFRVHESIAEPIEIFCRAYLDSSFEFKGMPGNLPSPSSYAYIARTNSGLIKRMIDLHEEGIEFTLTRSAKEIFKLPLILMNLRPDSTIFEKQYKYLLDELRLYNSDVNLQREYEVFFGYLLSKFSYDRELTGAIKLIMAKNASKIYDVYNYIKLKEVGTSTITLSTAHSSKGLEFDEVTIEKDFELPDVIESEDDLVEYNLYYVACTRARYYLNDAHGLYLTKQEDKC